MDCQNPTMIDFKFRPDNLFKEDTTSVLLVRLHYPESTWGEQISLYAHLIDGKIHYEAVDFYGNEYVLYPGSSWEPLTMEEAIYLIEGMQLNRDTQESAMALVLDGIPEAESSFYPQLRIYFNEKRKSFGLD